MMDRPLFRIGGYVVFGLLTFVIALLVTFPDGAIKQIAAVQIEHQLEQNMKKNVEVKVDDLDLWWLGLELEDLNISEAQASADEPSNGSSDEGTSGDNGETSGESSQPFGFTIPSIGARLAPISSILNLGLSAQYHLGLGGGSISGTYTRTSGSQSLYLSINDLDLNKDKTPLFNQLTGVPMFGTLSGSGTFEFMPNRPVVTDGSFEMNGKKITIGPKKELKLQAIPFGHVNVPQTNFGNIELRLHVEKEGKKPPRVVLDEWRSGGPSDSVDLQLQIWSFRNHIELANRAGNAEAQLKLRLRLNPDFVEENEGMRAMLRNEKLQNGKDGDWYGLVFFGPLNNLNWEGSKQAAAGPGEGSDGEDGDASANQKPSDNQGG